MPPFHSFLFVCTGNICRSPIAEVLWRSRLSALDGGFRAASAGTAALVDQPADDHAIAVMHEWGLDLSAHRARQLDLELARDHDLILVMDERHRRWIEARMPGMRGRVYRLGRWTCGDVFDPHTGPEREFRQVRDLIDRATDAWLARIT